MLVEPVPGTSLAHRLDPRTKLCFQIGFALAAFAHTTPLGLVALTVVALAVLWLSSTPLLPTLRAYRGFAPFLIAGPLLGGVALGPPWFVLARAVDPALASYRVVLVLLVSTAYIRTTPVRVSRAAVQRLVPGRPGALLGSGLGFLLRFLPLMRADLATVRDAMNARLAEQRPLHERMRLVAVTGLRRVFRRSDTLALALQTRCYSWNPTLPRLRLSRLDVPVLGVAALLVLSALF